MSKIIEICEDIIHIQKMKRRAMEKIPVRDQMTGKKMGYMTGPPAITDEHNRRIKEKIAELVKTSGMSLEEVFLPHKKEVKTLVKLDKTPYLFEDIKEEIKNKDTDKEVVVLKAKALGMSIGEVFPDLPNGTMIIKRASVGPTMSETPIIGIDFDGKEAARVMAKTLAEGKKAIDNLSEAFKKESELIRVVNTKCKCGKVNIFQESKVVGSYNISTTTCCKEARVETLHITREELNELIKTARGHEYIKKWDEIPTIKVNTEKIVASEDSPECGARHERH